MFTVEVFVNGWPVYYRTFKSESLMRTQVRKALRQGKVFVNGQEWYPW